jgi:hypothetical protein
MVNLVFLSLYFWYLEGVFDLKKTMGNLSPESSYQNQKMWMDSALITKYIDKSMVPMPIYKTTFYDLFDENFLVPLFESGDYYPYLVLNQQLYKMIIFMCDCQMVEETATESLLHVGYSPALPNDVIQALNPVLVDRQMYYDFNLDNDIDEIRSAYDYLKPCPTRNYFSNFQIGLSDLGILWCILATGILIALLVSIYHCITSKIRKKKGKFVFSGTRSLRNKRISKVIGISTLLFTGVSILSIRYLYSPSILKRTNDAKPRMKEILSEKRLKSEWSKIIKQKARWRFNLMFRMAMLTISREAKKSKNYKKDPSKLLQPIFKKNKAKKAEGAHHWPQALGSFLLRVNEGCHVQAAPKPRGSL